VQAAGKSPRWSLRIAAATAMLDLMATSKLTLREPMGGGIQSSILLALDF
jgi:hypothetical protein